MVSTTPTNVTTNNYAQQNYNYNSYNYAQEQEYPIDVKEHPDCFEYVYERPASTGKKVGVGIASGFIPGLGQMINGQWGKGLGFIAGNIGISFIMSAIFNRKLPKGLSFQEILKHPEFQKGQTFGSIAGLAVTALSIFDAVKNAKKKETVVVPKQQTQFNQPYYG